VATLNFAEARAAVLRESLRVARPRVESVPLHQAAGRVLAEDVKADRDLPPFARSTRDGWAVRAADVPGTLRVAGEVRAGERFPGHLNAGQAVAIMTGAPLMDGADAVVMVEHSTPGEGVVRIPGPVEPGTNVVPRGAEAHAGDALLTAGTPLGAIETGLLAAVGATSVAVYARPRVAILATGDEVVEPEETPQEFQIRNSNAYMLAAQVERAGGVAQRMAIVRDTLEATRAALEEAFSESELVLLSGGVSAGRYDVVEPALAALGAVFHFDRVRMQPGQPLVFGEARGRLFFGLPGNPVSTLVTYEVLARAAQEALGGVAEPVLRMYDAEMGEAFRQAPGLTRFLPARFDEAGRVRRVTWQGSGDLAALARAEAFLVADADRAEWKEGDRIRVLPR
jgi:molybdopterin molybdotransferase